uniref:Uncharacterized protein n=1 Tax=Hordeum vulgare subsp. vulgare TaxID=112509 RepID=A0A8I6Y8L6_HORVV
MDSRPVIVCFLMVLALLANPTSSENCMVVDDRSTGGDIFCTKPICKLTCTFEARDRKGKLKDYHCEKKNIYTSYCFCTVCFD